MPVAITLSGATLTILERCLAVPWPDEGCALLLGHRQGEALQLTGIWPCLNVWHPGWPGPASGGDTSGHASSHGSDNSRRNRFVVDPRELIAAHKHCRHKDALLLGVAHSHPRGAARPSALDQRHAWGDSVMWISAMPEPSAAGANRRAWWVAGPGAQLQPLAISHSHNPHLHGPQAAPAAGRGAMICEDEAPC